MKTEKNNNTAHVIASISTGRVRTNILNGVEQKLIAFLVQRIPHWISPDMLTALGFTGNLIVLLGFIVSTYIHTTFLLVGIVGFIISWIGDSLDGRIAYYRNIPRKWYGFTLDLTVDWIGIILIGFGFMMYIEPAWKMIVYAFIVLYGWEIITAILRYKITGKYSIDSGLMGPTEVRIIVSAILVLEVLIVGSIAYVGVLVVLALLISNLTDFYKLLKIADGRDFDEKNKIRNEA